MGCLVYCEDLGQNWQYTDTTLNMNMYVNHFIPVLYVIELTYDVHVNTRKMASTLLPFHHWIDEGHHYDNLQFS